MSKFGIRFTVCFLFCMESLLFGADKQNQTEPFVQKGRIFYEVALGLEQVENLSPESNTSAQSYLRYLSVDQIETRLFGLAGIQDSIKKIGASGNNQKISLEYLFHDWIGIGGSLQNSFITTSNLSKNDT